MTSGMIPCAFAIPGDPRQKTGGYIYEWRLLKALKAQGREVLYLRLPEISAEPSPATLARTMALLGALPPGRPLILDGLVFASLPTALLARLPMPVIAMLHHPMGLEQGLPPDLSRRLLAQERANLAHAARIVVTSRHTSEVYRGLGADPARITVALPGYDGPRRHRREDAGPRILSVGLMARRKGHDVLVRALAGVADLDWTARIVGKAFDPAVPGELAALVESLGLAGRITLAGPLSEAALEREWRQARIFALATRYEGYGMALAEALTWGLPIVTCAAGAVPGTVDGAAVLAPPDDPAEFAAALRRVLTSSTERARLAALARTRAAGLPRWAETAAVMGRVVDSLG